MKSISISLISLALISFSCTPDTIIGEKTIGASSKKENLKSGSSSRELLSVENSANKFDFAGKVHNDILDIYLKENHQLNTAESIGQQLNAIVNSKPHLKFLNLQINQSARLDNCQNIISDPQMQFDDLIAKSPLTQTAKISFSAFMDLLNIMETENYETIHQFIISYESKVFGNSKFNDEDKRIILTTTSIVRYSFNYKVPRKDKDWESSVGNRTAAFSGAISNVDAAIEKALVVGIMISSLKK